MKNRPVDSLNDLLRCDCARTSLGVTHNYVRHGTSTLFAALDIANGQVIAQCRPRHRHQESLLAAYRCQHADLPHAGGNRSPILAGLRGLWPSNLSHPPLTTASLLPSDNA
jgi:hypothetical protein